jgi:hypothetical protein
LNNVLVPLFIFGLFAGAVWWHARTKVPSAQASRRWRTTKTLVIGFLVVAGVLWAIADGLAFLLGTSRPPH